ncbi:bifunctional protein FolD 2 isoform X1 [Cryptomeria japonica]|uniref:bifunctional protein FolD 2 isoform X1 n=1 Tax=Cryptomeria japonica TaxID=3369 RepID=UPI0027DA6DEC|nr:bifunctional protein FolD 2 isoform X1 [Cryptomeria japonica]
MLSPLWRRAELMGALSWSATTFLSAAATSKQRHFRSSIVTWESRLEVTAPEKTGRAPLLGWNMPDRWTLPLNWHPPAALPDPNSMEPIAAVIDGKAIAQEIRNEVAVEVSKMRDALGKVPGLAVVLVGARKDSETYVRSKKKACVEAGIASLGIDLPEDSSEEEVEKAVRTFNDDPSIHGVLVQLPLPQHINEEKILNTISIEKDVDGFHPLNIGRLAMQGRKPLFVPCTPKGCIELLLRSGIDMMGKKAVVIGRSNIVGMPVSMLLQRHNATVTIVHSYTKNPTDFTREADILVAAAGVPNLVRGDWLKPGAVVIDVGINAVEDPNAKRGYRLVGDVCYEEASRIASAITPVPGGVGPMTIAMLLSNTLESAKRAYGFN